MRRIGTSVAWLVPALTLIGLTGCFVGPGPAYECVRAQGTDFDAHTAWQMATLSNHAYSGGLASLEPGDDLAAPGLPGCWVLVDSIERGAVNETLFGQNLFIAQDPYTGDIVVSFRGSNSALDYYLDVSFRPSLWFYAHGEQVGLVHKGFNRSYQRIQTELRSSIDSALLQKPGSARVYFTGHSLGGTMAQLAALDLAHLIQDNGYAEDNLVVYTFGAPRAISALSPRLQQDYVERVPHSYTVANWRDLVPHAFSLLYTHVGKVAAMHTVEENQCQKCGRFPVSTTERARVTVGPGRDYQKCPRKGFWAKAFHSRERYVDTFKSDVFETTLPSLAVTTSDGYATLEWDGDFVVGRCDWIGLYDERPPDDVDDYLDWNWAVELEFLDNNSQDGSNSPTVTGSARWSNYYAAYVDGAFDQIIRYSEPSTIEVPTCLKAGRKGRFANNVQVDWRVSNPGYYDIVGLYDGWPQDPDSYYRRQWVLDGRGEDKREETFYGVGGGTLWVAYIAQKVRNVRRGAQIVRREPVAGSVSGCP